MADRDEIETLIFDEIDVGISGRTAQKVSEKMAVIGKNHQVICICLLYTSMHCLIMRLKLHFNHLQKSRMKL